MAEFQLNLLNLDIHTLSIPDTEYPTSIKMSSTKFVSLCRDFTQLSDTLKIEVKEQKATFSINGKAGVEKIVMKNNNAEKVEDQITIVSDGEVSLSFGLQYLNSFAKASSLSGIVTLKFSSGFFSLMMIEYEMQDIGFIKFYLAPKMDEDNVEQ